MRYRGFTLIELLVSLAILAILLAVAVPSLQSFAQKNRLSGLTNDLVSALNIARSEAIKRGTEVTVCKSANISSASPTCSTTAAWKDGWMTFVDGSTVGVFDGSDVRLKVSQPPSGAATTKAETALADYVQYKPNGAGTSSGSMVVCVGTMARTITISAAGRTRVTEGGSCL